MALKNKQHISRAIALLDKGLTVEQATSELRKRYHPETQENFVRSAYFAKRGPTAISSLERKSHDDLLRALLRIKSTLNQRSETMRKLHQNPEFAEKSKAASSETMRKLHQNPEFAERHKAASSERMRKLNQNPEFVAASSERMRKLNQNPEFAEKHKAAASKTMHKLNQNPEFVAASSERMRKLNQNPEFANRLKTAIKKFWKERRNGKSTVSQPDISGHA